MDIQLDNIIFSLQKAGGASVVWQQHLERLLKDNQFQPFCLEYNNAELNFFRKQLKINQDLLNQRSSKYLFIERYLNLNSQQKSKHLFHSSHYRIEKGKNIINVTTVHDFTYEYFISGFRKKIHSWQKNTAINNSKGIICVSESTKKDLLRFLPHINENKIRVIYNGVDEHFKLLNDNVIIEKKHLFEDYSYALYIGDRRTAYKNFDMAVDACRLAQIPLLIIGGGALTQEELYKLNVKLGTENYFILLGVSLEDLNYYYNRAYCLLYPSLYEGFGIPVIEAQRAGCPVVATHSSSIPEVIGNEYLMLQDPTAEKIFHKIKEISIDSNLRKETIERGLFKSKNYSWERTYQQTTEFYRELYFEK
ncbi:mannosyltransferase [Flavobacterium sp. 270]|uniref:glycosyltransferase family 4 protein n=1 Tax=Flavobacterium sp. 270 TaxID=2512114 RepID=UPI001065A17A|nr:glycosyltransferase family 1 protein [Flavobacterium sp. 270]TDW47122.1 mannosyltransferase [Flavobacterium sp. 270]